MNLKPVTKDHWFASGSVNSLVEDAAYKNLKKYSLEVLQKYGITTRNFKSGLDFTSDPVTSKSGLKVVATGLHNSLAKANPASAYAEICVHKFFEDEYSDKLITTVGKNILITLIDDLPTKVYIKRLNSLMAEKGIKMSLVPTTRSVVNTHPGLKCITYSVFVPVGYEDLIQLYRMLKYIPSFLKVYSSLRRKAAFRRKDLVEANRSEYSRIVKRKEEAFYKEAVAKAIAEAELKAVEAKAKKKSSKGIDEETVLASIQPEKADPAPKPEFKPFTHTIYRQVVEGAF